MADDAAMVPSGEDHREIRDAIRSICEKYPGSYWREVEDADDYPEKFVHELTKVGLPRRADPGGVRRLGPREFVPAR